MRPPDVDGFAKAWYIENKSGVADHQATLAMWLVNAPWAHPFWSWWNIGLLHLRDIPGVKPAHKKYPEAEFEFIILSIDPDWTPIDDASELAKNGIPFLHPPDVIEQFHGVSDHDARRITEAAVRAVCAGHISPDQDYRSVWHTTIHDTVDHFRAGAHVES
jgi:hypothetical protein